MVNPAVALLGPLVGLECRRAIARGWLILVRALAALALMSAVIVVLWIWWTWQATNAGFLPFSLLRGGLEVAEGMLVTIGLVLAPAVLAGSLAGDQERGALGMLLTTGVSAREIVSARMVGKLTQVAMILMAGIPAIVLLATLAGMNLDVQLSLLALPSAVAVGGGGLATAVSATSRRGRDALLAVYLIDLLSLLTPLASSLGFNLGGFRWVVALNPYACLGSLVWREDATSALVSSALWTSVGFVGLAIATWSLVPATLGHLDGERTGRLRRRRRRVPPLRDRPMLWKELHIERAGTVGGVGWWLGAAVTLLLGAGSLALAGPIVWEWLSGVDRGWFAWSVDVQRTTITGSATFVGCLLEWAVGLRAAVSIVSERERGTWDAILTSPLEAREILRAKVWGALHALRALFGAALLAWTIALISEAMPFWAYVENIVGTLVVGWFMAAVGVRSSLACASATRAMAVTIGLWLGAEVAFSIVAALLVGLVGVISFAVPGILGSTFTPPPALLAMIPMVAAVSWVVTRDALHVLAAALIVGTTRALFDRLAGRRAGGRFAVAADRAFHGAPRVSLEDFVAVVPEERPVTSRRPIPGPPSTVEEP